MMILLYAFLLDAATTRIHTYWDDLAEPLGIVGLSILLGILIERVAIGLGIKFFERRKWPIGRRLLRSFNGVVTTWFGLAAFRSVLHDFPLKPSVLPTIGHISTAVFILSICLLISRVIVAFVRTYSTQHERAVQSISLIENIVRAIVYLLGLLVIFHAFGIAVTPILAALGVGGLAVALALQDTLGNFFAGISILISKQVEAGDYVKLDSGQEGAVRDISWRVTTLQTPMNTLIIVPNSKFSTSILTNYDRPEKFMNLIIELPLDASVQAATFEQIALQAARGAKAAIPNVIEGEPVLRYTAVTATGATLQLSMRITDFSQQGEVRHEVLKRIYNQVPIPASAQIVAPTTSQKTEPPRST
jgi:small-conductance mechanosensitive channel